MLLTLIVEVRAEGTRRGQGVKLWRVTLVALMIPWAVLCEYFAGGHLYRLGALEKVGQILPHKPAGFGAFGTSPSEGISDPLESQRSPTVGHANRP
jgi:hypothetical protein